MNRGLKFVAALLATFIVIVPFLGLDALPRDLRKQMEVQMRQFRTQNVMRENKSFGGNVFEGEVIEGEAVRVDTERDRP